MIAASLIWETVMPSNDLPFGTSQQLQVRVATAAQHAELMQVLDDRLIATADVPGLVLVL